MSLAHDLIDAALGADLNKNELNTFLVLFRQTLCFGKTSDALTTKRIAKLSGIRKDRIKPTLKRLVSAGLFEVAPHKLYEHTFTLAAHFLAQSEAGFNAPSHPENGKPTQKTGKKLPEKRLHTVIPTTAKTTTTTTNTPQRTQGEPFTPPRQTDTEGSRSDLSLTAELPYPSTWDSTQRSKAAQVLDGLSPQLVHDCLLLLAHSLNKGKVSNAMGYLHTLVRAARNNTLDRSALMPTATQTTESQPHLSTRLTELKAEIAGIDALFIRAGMPMDNATAAKRAGYIDQYNALKQGLGG